VGPDRDQTVMRSAETSTASAQDSRRGLSQYRRPFASPNAGYTGDMSAVRPQCLLHRMVNGTWSCSAAAFRFAPTAPQFTAM
jgi:hypothetical protein